jgi:hypothetical protein
VAEALKAKAEGRNDTAENVPAGRRARAHSLRTPKKGASVTLGAWKTRTRLPSLRPHETSQLPFHTWMRRLGPDWVSENFHQ